MKKVAFVGVGIMGGAMVNNLLNAGYDVTLYTHTKAKVQPLLDRGCHWAANPKEAAAAADVTFSIVGYPKDVEEIYFGENNILEGAKAGSYVVDMTTSSPSLAIRIAEAAEAKGLHALDAPVTGGQTGAIAGTLTVFVGGKREDYDAILDVFLGFGKKIVYMGKAGMGQHTKAINQIALGGALATAAEALLYAQKVGISPAAARDALTGGAADGFQLQNTMGKALNGDMEPGFFIHHYIKDMKIAVEEAAKVGLDMTVLNRVLAQFEELAADGYREKGTQAIIKYYDRDADLTK